MSGERAATPLRLLLVCTANICRSPYAQGRARALAIPGLQVDSAGTHARDGHVMDPVMAAELARRGADDPGFASRALTPRVLAEADVIVTMEAAHREWILTETPHLLARTWTLGQLHRDLADTGADLDGRHGSDLLAALARRRGPASRALDVADPYGAGAAAAAEAAERIDALLLAVLPRLVATGERGGDVARG